MQRNSNIELGDNNAATDRSVDGGKTDVSAIDNAIIG